MVAKYGYQLLTNAQFLFTKYIKVSKNILQARTEVHEDDDECLSWSIKSPLVGVIPMEKRQWKFQQEHTSSVAPANNHKECLSHSKTAPMMILVNNKQFNGQSNKSCIRHVWGTSVQNQVVALQSNQWPRGTEVTA